MFRQLATLLTVPPNYLAAADAVLTEFRPSQLSDYLELFWRTPRDPNRQLALGVAAAAQLPMARPDRLDPLLGSLLPHPTPPPAPVAWHHLVYAYMLENTRIVDIFRRVVAEWVSGERLPAPTVATQRWLQATEQVFFASPWTYSIRAVTSHVRSDAAAVRRNAYYRLLGIDLNHGQEDGRPYPYVKADVANREFCSLFEALLTEAWRGYANITNLVGANYTDHSAIATLIRRLQEMLLSRRHQGTLSREEFDAVALTSWLHLTVEYDTAIVSNLNAQAAGTADRLTKIGALVGLPAHARSDSYFELAEPMSRVLIDIESGAAAAAGPAAAYNATTQFGADMLTIITHWAIVTGRNVKDASMRQPLGAVLRGLPAGTPSRNGDTGRTAVILQSR